MVGLRPKLTHEFHTHPNRIPENSMRVARPSGHIECSIGYAWFINEEKVEAQQWYEEFCNPAHRRDRPVSSWSEILKPLASRATMRSSRLLWYGSLTLDVCDDPLESSTPETVEDTKKGWKSARYGRAVGHRR